MIKYLKCLQDLHCKGNIESLVRHSDYYPLILKFSKKKAEDCYNMLCNFFSCLKTVKKNSF